MFVTLNPFFPKLVFEWPSKILKKKILSNFTCQSLSNILKVKDRLQLNVYHFYNFVLVLPLKWEQANTLKSVFQLITKQLHSKLLSETEREQGSGETERDRVCVCECWSKPMIALISIHKRRGIEKHIWQ